MANIVGTPLNDTIVGTALSDTLDGAAGNDLIFGYGSMAGGIGLPPPVLDPAGGGAADDDSLVGGLGNDTVRAGGGTDTLTGGVGNDVLFGDDGDDSIDGGAGSDKMTGGAGDDTYVVDTMMDLVSEQAAGGSDKIQSSISLTIAAEVETLQLVGSASINATGNARTNILLGNGAANILDGKGGADTMDGGDGDDTYLVDDPGDQVAEKFADAAGGTDLVLSAVSHNLGNGIENLTLTGSGASNGTGNALANLITGNAAGNQLTGSDGNDTLNGGAGADTMTGGKDNDTYVVDNKLDSVVEQAGEGTDTLRWALASSLVLTDFAEVENATLLGMAAINLTGTAGNNALAGNGGANKIDGAGGDDTMAGGGGSDSYTVDGGDQVVELAGGGTDLVTSSADFTLGANIENLTLTGAAVIGNGNGLANTILGNDVGNSIDGGAGADKMAGGKGDDTYVVDNVGDKVTELAGGGLLDSVLSSISYTLGSELEQLTLTGAANINGTGNAQANKITGNDGNNILDGKAGADTLDGGNGNDTLIVDDPGEKTSDSGTGIDQVLSSTTHTIGTGIENLTLTGMAASGGAGNALANKIVGNAAANDLNGGAGADTLLGGNGNDILTDTLGDDSDRFDGGAGADTMNAGDGDDVYIVDNVGDRAEEIDDDTLAGAGIHDRVESSVTFALHFTMDDLTLTGSAAINGTGNDDVNIVIGNSGANKLFGLGGADSLDGGGGNDTLDGGASDADADTLHGGAGNDLYLIGDGDVAVEEPGGGGIDTVQSTDTVNTFLAAGIENLILMGTSVQGVGNALANVIIGDDQNNSLDGLAGADTMIGGNGNDLYTSMPPATS
jgi:Ca2+-binding RTX toxin-like protein